MPGARSVLLALGAALLAALVTLVGLPQAHATTRPARPSSLVTQRALTCAPPRERPDRPSVRPTQCEGTRGRRADLHGALPGLTATRDATSAPSLTAPPPLEPARRSRGSRLSRAPPPS
jgi:hypothetical protein